MDLLRHYSNRADLLARLTEACRRVSEQDVPASLEANLTVPAPTVRAWRVRDRLTDDDVQVLIAAFLAGTSKRELAERYGLGLTTVKNLLRRHGVRRTP